MPHNFALAPQKNENYSWNFGSWFAVTNDLFFFILHQVLMHYQVLKHYCIHHHSCQSKMLKNNCSYWSRGGTIPYLFSLCIYLHFPIFVWLLLLHCTDRFRCRSAVAQSLPPWSYTKKFSSSISMPLVVTSFVFMANSTTMKEKKPTKWIWASSKGQRSQWLSLKYFSEVEMIKPYVYFEKFWITVEVYKHYLKCNINLFFSTRQGKDCDILTPLDNYISCLHWLSW